MTTAGARETDGISELGRMEPHLYMQEMFGLPPANPLSAGWVYGTLYKSVVGSVQFGKTYSPHGGKMMPVS